MGFYHTVQAFHISSRYALNLCPTSCRNRAEIRTRSKLPNFRAIFVLTEDFKKFFSRIIYEFVMD